MAGRRAVHADLRNALAAEGAEAVVGLDQAARGSPAEAPGSWEPRRRQARGQAPPLLVEDHLLVQGVADGLQDGAVHLPQGEVGVDRRAAVVQAWYFAHLDGARADVDRHLAEMRGVRDGGVIAS